MSHPTFTKKSASIFHDWNMPSYQELLSKEEALAEKAASIIRQAQEREHKRFVEAGGCSTCDGRESVLTWDTMDSLDGAYAEFGPCSDCTEETRKAGVDKSFFSKYDRRRGFNFSVPLTEEEEETVNNINYQIEGVQTYLTDFYTKPHPIKGDFVVVVRGRKVTPGNWGRIFWRGVTKFGTERIGVRNDKNEIAWVDPLNVARIDPDQIDPEIVEAIDKHQKAYFDSRK